MYNWERYTKKGYSEKLVNHIRDIVLNADITEIKPECISSVAETPIKDVSKFLRLLYESDNQGAIQIKHRFQCPFCGNQFLTDRPEHFCESTNDYVETSELEVEEYYLLAVEPSRDIKWAVVIHGMNTRGAWQEDLVWKLSNLYKYSIPVFVYKYGLVQIGALLPFLQKRKVREFASHLRTISEVCNSDDKPDVIAHSFGTWIIANTLKQNPDIKIGRLVLLGSIIRPDFDWEKLLDNGQVEAILNHIAGKDKPVRMCQFFIPDSGPGGKEGFITIDQRVTNIMTPEFGHDGYFKKNRMTKYLSPDGIWTHFLRRPSANLPYSFPDSFSCEEWKSSNLIFRFSIRIISILFLTIIALLPYFIWLVILKFLEAKDFTSRMENPLERD